MIRKIEINLVDNACKYAAAAEDRRLHIQLCQSGGRAMVRVRDHGPGISDGAVRRLFRPFSKSVDEAANSAPGVSLGLALSRRLACQIGGQLQLEKVDGDGASFVFSLPLDT